MKIKKICCLTMVMVFLFICGCGKADDTIKEPVKELTKEETVKEFLIKNGERIGDKYSKKFGKLSVVDDKVQVGSMKIGYYAIEYYDDGKFGIYCLDKNGETKEETIYKFSFGKFVEGSGLYNLITTDTGDYYGKFSFDEVEIDEQGMAKMCSIHLLDDCGRPEDYDTIEELNRNRYTLCVGLLYLTKDASFYLSLVEHIYINFVTGQR